MRSGSQSVQGAPTLSNKAATILGARPISAATYNARSNFAITPDSSGSNTPIGTLPPPMSLNQPTLRAASSSGNFSSPSLASSLGANYNLFLTPQPATSNYFSSSSSSSAPNPIPNYMQPMQPMNIALSTPLVPSPMINQTLQSASSPSIPVVSRTPAIDWKTSNGQQNQQTVQWGNQHMQPVVTQPPGWNPSVILQPQKKETNYDWGDLDPMR